MKYTGSRQGFFVASSYLFNSQEKLTYADNRNNAIASSLGSIEDSYALIVLEFLSAGRHGSSSFLGCSSMERAVKDFLQQNIFSTNVESIAKYEDFNQLFCPLRTSALTQPLDRHLTDKGPAMGPLVFGPERRRLLT